MNKLFYTGIGSRKTPGPVCKEMMISAVALYARGWWGRSGHADAADKSFEAGGKDKFEVYLPWRGFNGSDSLLYDVSEEAKYIASQYHPYWNNLKEPVRNLMGRNVYQVIGKDFTDYSKFVACWTADGKASGGTGMAMRLAAALNIPIYNYYDGPTAADFAVWYKNNIAATEKIHKIYGSIIA